MVSEEKIYIRNITPDDVESIYNLVDGSLTLRTYDKYLYRILSEYFTKTCLVAESDNEIVGFILCFISQDDPSILFIWQIFVRETYRGKLVTQKLNKQIRDVAREMGCTKLHFTIASDSKLGKSMKKLSSIPFNSVSLHGLFLKSTKSDNGEEKIDILYETII
ncbi:GNAT family N-acetyltransferase [Candidatus Poribacteria bacterium]|nr:GNAT family N-acetyltransferase [Candidatus Poribacteria bacterium]